jgi:hypothetical protein
VAECCTKLSELNDYIPDFEDLDLIDEEIKEDKKKEESILHTDMRNFDDSTYKLSRNEEVKEIKLVK